MEPLFYFYLWDRLLTQVNMTLNMFWRYRLNPELLAHEQLDDIQSFECSPLSLLVYKAKINEKPHKWLTHDPHSVNGW